MAPTRKKAPTPEGNTDSDSGAHQSSLMPAALQQIVTNIEKIRAKRSKVRKAIETDFAHSVAEMKARITKHYDTEKIKRSEIMNKQLDRLAKAIEKKAACEDAIINMIGSLSEEGANLAALMNSVHAGRQNAINVALNAHQPEKRR
ncbi:hypothetical protein BKA67DRAFT_547711 [Truncatella angustata]|uniref:Uncharacterized protein n=1 Tax=Truncatella angustata TaxID=152316 RepID=A0A9P8UY69_9PEZI|nr:uncharacterized protein BKA67DRAFT_547711 [Truncatella angustata]KAH6660353.1 hypothetical protein BKA67DRAFT_547711 [Truncatella angustata]KAH8201868.1 hypothetical protein TruAng_003955 [Truncatella angustata]